jgi:hypothetical protein
MIEGFSLEEGLIGGEGRSTHASRNRRVAPSRHSQLLVNRDIEQIKQPV